MVASLVDVKVSLARNLCANAPRAISMFSKRMAGVARLVNARRLQLNRALERYRATANSAKRTRTQKMPMVVTHAHAKGHLVQSLDAPLVHLLKSWPTTRTAEAVPLASVKAKSAKHQSAIASEVKNVSMARMDMAVRLAVARVSLAQQPSSRSAHWPKNQSRRTMRGVAIFILAKARFAASLPAIAKRDKSWSQAKIGMVARRANAKELPAKHPAALHVPKPNGSKKDWMQGDATLSLAQEQYAKHPLAGVSSDRSLRRARTGMDAKPANALVSLVKHPSANRAQWPRSS